MATEVVGLDPASFKLLKRLLDRLAKNPLNGPLTTDVPVINQTADIYIAKIPSGGIPVISGTTPGSVACDIYYIDNSSGTPTLTQISGYTETVYNITTTVIPAGYIVIEREKFGCFVPASASSGTGSTGAIIMFGTLSATLTTSGTAKVTSLTNYSGGGSAPTGNVTAANPLKWAGNNGDTVILLQNTANSSQTGTGSDEWTLLAVMWDVINPVTDVADEGGAAGTGTVGNEVNETKTPFIGKATGTAPTTTAIFQTQSTCP